jgi:indole-3-glycerol phosphate synthase
VASYLDAILAHHRELAKPDAGRIGSLIAAARDAPPPRDVVSALTTRASGAPAVIAEIKRRSPMNGLLRPVLDPAGVAASYAAHGASAISVLTDERYFGGSPSDLIAARAACELPVLRKDFTVSAGDVYAARAMGADAVLLIAAALDGAALEELHDLVTELGMAALVEIHDECELERALDAGATLVGVNQRDLESFEVDTERALRLAKALPVEVCRVAESGIASGVEARALAVAGFDAVLVGEHFMSAADPGEALRIFLDEAGRCS